MVGLTATECVVAAAVGLFVAAVVVVGKHLIVGLTAEAYDAAGSHCLASDPFDIGNFSVDQYDSAVD